MNNTAKTYYEILEVDPNADAATIRKSYLKKSLKYHPDKNPNNVEEAKARFVEIGQAYETLSDPDKRRVYDRELRSGRTPNSSSGFGGGGGSSYNNVNAKTYDSYMDAFDETVAGMSEAELAATIGTVAALAGIVGSLVGSRMLGGGAERSASGGQHASRGSSILGSVGSVVGGMVASEIASSSVRALHQDSMKRLSYREECRRAVERGEPPPEPPKASFIGKQIGEALKNTMSSVSNFASEAADQNNSNRHSTNFDGTNQNNDSERREGSKKSKAANLWRMAAAGVKAAQAANQR